MRKKIICIWAAVALSLFSACGKDSVQTDEVPSAVSAETTLESTEAIKSSEAENSYKKAVSASTDEIVSAMTSLTLPKLNINEGMSPAEIIRAGKRAGKFFGGNTERFFGGQSVSPCGAAGFWKAAKTEDGNGFTKKDGEKYCKIDGFFIEDNLYIPVNYNAAKQYLMYSLFLTEKGFEDMCSNSPSLYTETDGSLYIRENDDVTDEYSYAEITDYTLNEDGTVTYNCRLVGNDKTFPFTFTLKKDGFWKLDGCSDGFALFFMKDIDLAPKIDIDENDETVVRGREFAESYAEMSWNYLHGAAWENYADIKYFDFDDKSEENYFEKDGIPFYRLLIAEYTYDELLEYIKSFCTDEIFEQIHGNLSVFIAEKDNCIFVNGNEPTFLYPMRNERAQIIGYRENADGTVTYDCYAKTTVEADDDLYFSFTINEENKLCGEYTASTDPDLGCFSTVWY